MQFVAFFRNVNQGQRGHPSTADLLTAVHATGATDAFAFRSNGTVVFDSGDIDSVAGALQREQLSGREVFVRPATFFESLMHYEGSPLKSRLEVTIFESETSLAEAEADADVVHDAERRGRCEIVESAAGWALVLNHSEHQSNGTPVVERIIGGPATSRGLSTLLGLARQLDP